MSIKVPIGTRIYLTRPRPHNFYIQPDTILLDEFMFVSYDVRIDGRTVIPRGTIIVGDWITESDPCFAAQFQATKIIFRNFGKRISADSEIIESVSAYNNCEVYNSRYLYKTLDYISVANIRRRVVDVQCDVKCLPDHRIDSLYLEICTKEIPLILTRDFYLKIRDIEYLWIEREL
jgi:hypothetical protein